MPTSFSNSSPFTDDEYAVICGTLLGDAHLNRRGPSSFRLKVEHGEGQEEYCRWKRHKLLNLCQKNQDVHLVTNARNRSRCYRFYTDSSVIYRPVHEAFYLPVERGGKTMYVKRVTPRLLDALPNHPLLLTCWFFDDGSGRPDAYAGRFATQGFAYDEQELLRDFVRDAFDIELTIALHTARTNQYSLSIPASEFGKFVNIVKPFVQEVPSMQYKLNEERRNQSRFFS